MMPVRINEFLLSSKVLIVFFGGRAFSTTPLGLVEWLWCLVFGFGDLPSRVYTAKIHPILFTGDICLISFSVEFRYFHFSAFS